MADIAQRDQNHVTSMLFVGADGGVYNAKGDQVTGRLYVDLAGGSGTVTSVSVVSANGFAGTVATATSTPAITISTTVNAPVLAGNGTAIAAATTTGSGSTVVLATDAVLVTPNLGTPSVLVATNATGTAAGLSIGGTAAIGTTVTVANEAADSTCFVAFVTAASGNLGVKSNAGLTFDSTTGALTATSFVGNVTGNAATVTFANEATDATCFIAFATAASGNLAPKTNVNMTFDSSTGVATFASTVLTTTDINGGTIDGTIIGGASAAAGTFTTATAEGFVPTSGTTTGNRMYLVAANTLAWSINSVGEMRLTSTELSPAGDGGLSLGSTSLGWQNLFGNTGFVFNLENGDWVATHTAGILTVGTGDLRVTTAGTNTASVVTVGGTQTLTSKTLTSPTITTATLSGAQLLAEGASIQLDPTLSADGTYSGITITGTAGATLAFGDLVYLAVADSRWELTDADSATTAGAVLTGMCVLAAAADGSATTILLQGNIRADAAFPALTVGANVYAGLTPGDIVTTAPSATDDVVHVVGKALTADSIYFNPSPDYITIV